MPSKPTEPDIDGLNFLGTAIPDEALQLGNNKKIHLG